MSMKNLRTQDSKSFLNYPIDFRKITRLRSDHQSIDNISPELINQRQSLPTESRLERLVSLRKEKLEQRTPKMALMQYSSKNLKKQKEEQNKTLEAYQTILNEYAPRVKLETSSRLVSLVSQSMKQKEQLEQINERVRQIDDKLQRLINKKLNLITQKTRDKKKKQDINFNTKINALNQSFFELINEIKSLRSKYNNVNVFNTKIRFIETLIAEQNTQIQLMKKYYSNQNSNRIKGKIGDFTHFKSKLKDLCKDLNGYEKEKKKIQFSLNDSIRKSGSMVEETTNNKYFKEPKSNDYESYRYKHKNYSINPQPMPRSSYRREYLYLKTEPEEMIINRDHAPYNPKVKTPARSMYYKDYKSLKTDLVNHKELDAYKDKYNTLKISYMPEKKISSFNISQIKQYYKDVQESGIYSRIKQQSPGNHQASQQELNFNKNAHVSESKRQFLGQSQYQRSTIKHKYLKQLSYNLKSRFKA